MFVLQVYILKHTYFVKCYGYYNDAYEEKLKPIKVRMYVILLMVLCTVIPCVWILSSMVFWIVWFKRYSNSDTYHGDFTYWRLRDKIIYKTLYKFLMTPL